MLLITDIIINAECHAKLSGKIHVMKQRFWPNLSVLSQLYFFVVLTQLCECCSGNVDRRMRSVADIMLNVRQNYWDKENCDETKSNDCLLPLVVGDCIDFF